MVDLEKVQQAMIDVADYEGRGRPYMEYERIGNWDVVARAAFASIMEQIAEPTLAMVRAWEDAKPDTSDYEFGRRMYDAASELDDVEWAHCRANWRAMLSQLVEKPKP